MANARPAIAIRESGTPTNLTVGVIGTTNPGLRRVSNTITDGLTAAQVGAYTIGQSLAVTVAIKAGLYL